MDVTGMIECEKHHFLTVRGNVITAHSKTWGSRGPFQSPSYVYITITIVYWKTKPKQMFETHLRMKQKIIHFYISKRHYYGKLC